MRLKEEYGGWQRTVLQMFYNSLLAADLQISELLGFFDQDGDGMVSVQECTKALSSLELGLSRQQIQQLVLILGFDAAGPTPSKEAQIDLEAYLKRLALVADHTVIARSEQELLDLQQIATWINDLAKKTNKSCAPRPQPRSRALASALTSALTCALARARACAPSPSDAIPNDLPSKCHAHHRPCATRAQAVCTLQVVGREQRRVH